MAQLRALHGGAGWTESFQRIACEAIGEFLLRAAHQPAAERLLEHLRFIGERPCTQEELAQGAGLARETVTRTLKALEARGAVTRLGGGYSCFAYRVERTASAAPEAASPRAGREVRAAVAPRTFDAARSRLGSPGAAPVEQAVSRPRRG